MVLMHEFGHSWAIYQIGNQYHSWHSNFKENWAIEFSNTRYTQHYPEYSVQNYKITWSIKAFRWCPILFPKTGGKGWNP